MLIPDLDNSQIDKILEFKKTLPQTENDEKWISDVDPLQRIAVGMVVSKKYTKEEIVQWVSVQEELIEKKMIKKI